ncbi:MAG: ankyrin repeat domain-containing protein [Nitrospiraceae bacterium]|nr:ankyrin repeat domain-containing protein [Nitrospiraceae bacterium]
MNLLVEAGANINAKNKNSITSLMWVTFNGNAEAVKLFIESNANLEAKDKYGWTASDLAERYGIAERHEDGHLVIKLFKRAKDK